MTPPRDAGSESGGRFRTVGQCRTRRDTGKRIAAESAAVAVAGPAAGLLPLPDFALTSAATWALNAMFFCGANPPATSRPPKSAAGRQWLTSGARTSNVNAPAPFCPGSG
ncbi:hypothetical protein PXH67_40615 (plasmid) [Streptomyces sp. P8-A8]|uniref:hypothetical protein n=1 Tax=Streptomyces sp. P8-A8 TaxID=3029759 RepID=UPI0036DBB2DE